MKNVAWILVPGRFKFSKNPLRKGFRGAQYGDLNKFRKLCYYISNIRSLLQNFHFPVVCKHKRAWN